MSISGYFTDFSFPEVLRFIHTSRKTGYLQTRPIDHGQVHMSYHFWFRNGEIVAVQHQGVSLQTLLTHVCQQTPQTIKAEFEKARAALSHPIGTILKQQGIVLPEELQMVFNRQVLQPVVYHFTVDNAWFKFEVNTALPLEEMTGLSLSPIQAALNGLRRLKNWDSLKSKLPEVTSRLRRTGKTFLTYQLNREEAYAWNLANEDLSLLQMATKLEVPVEEMQKLAFRLIVTGLVEECPDTRATTSVDETVLLGAEVESAPLQKSFISSLVGFLKKRA
ncbi:MAG: DUF4388 domain-containing protein [Chloroherpetonaceae bacterium]